MIGGSDYCLLDDTVRCSLSGAKIFPFEIKSASFVMAHHVPIINGMRLLAFGFQLEGLMSFVQI